MHIDTLDLGSWRPAGRLPLRLNVVIAYADLSSATLAKRILDEALAILSPQILIETTLWKFELLDSNLLQELAIQDAIHAHIIIIAAEKEYGLPAGARRWVEACLTNPEVKDVGFVALLREERETFGEIESVAEFRELNTSGKTEFFWFIAKDSDGNTLAAERIVQLACQMPIIPVIDGMECVA